MDLWWFEGLKADLLFAGVQEEPVAEIQKSKSGKKWALVFEIPGILGYPKYAPRLEARDIVQKLVADWFAYANTSRPATDRDGE